MIHKPLWVATFLMQILTGYLVAQPPQKEVQQWNTFEITLFSEENYKNPYTEVDVWAEFTNRKGDSLVRPAFWDGDDVWKIRFSPPDSAGIWEWKSFGSKITDKGLNGQKGSVASVPYRGTNALIRKGLLKMSDKKRNVIHHSGAPFFMVAETAWSIPFRATTGQVAYFAGVIQKKGFNTVLLSSLQPDRGATGPDERNTDQGFKRAFSDLKEGHINELRPSYFQYLDSIIRILHSHEIVPTLAVMLHGYGWKGLDVLGTDTEPGEYLRYCKYLLARYGSGPVMWLISVDGAGNAPGLEAGGEMFQKWDAYGQPTGIHYNPCDDFIADWALNLPDPLIYCMHGNRRHQDKDWLDFQWAQTGHDGFHQYHKVSGMYDNIPVKAVANGESTYEGMNDGKNGLDWWQGEDAWLQLMHGGTMGVVHGAASLWQWKISGNEKGWDSWTDQPRSWKGALKMRGGDFVGLIGKILEEIDMTDIERRWDLAEGKPLLARNNKLFISYLKEGEKIHINNLPGGLMARFIDPKTGKTFYEEKVVKGSFQAPIQQETILIIN